MTMHTRVLLVVVSASLAVLGLAPAPAVAAPHLVASVADVPADLPSRAAPAPRRLLIAGDSITQGSSGDYTWRYRLWKKLTATAPGQVTFVGPSTQLYDNVNDRQGSPYYAVPFPGEAHAATWGALLYDEVDRVADEVRSTGADTLVAMLGINDIVWQGASAADIKGMYRTYVQRARAAAPGIDIVLCKVLSRYDFFSKEYLQVGEARAVATALKELATEMDTGSERVVVADTLSDWDAKLDTWDSTHPNPTGETLIAQRVSAALAKIGLGTASPSIYETAPWKVRPSAPAVTAGAEEVTMAWDKVRTGATAMYLEYNLTNERDGFQRLPYGISDQTSWHLSPLVAGGMYEFRTVPIKGFMTGAPGAATSRRVTAKPFQRRAPSVSATPLSHGITGIWTKADGAQGYLLSYRTMAYRSPVTHLPYPVKADVGRFDVYPLEGGRYYRFRAVPVRGYVRGSWESSENVRTPGFAGRRAYIALGDSYSSGLGTHDDVDEYELDGPCRRTKAAWAFKMQDELNAWTNLVACQGDELDSGHDGGVRNQLELIQPFFARHPGAPQLVTVTVGGNDVGFKFKLMACYQEDCTYHEPTWTRDVREMTFPLKDFYDDLRDAAPNADIVVGGYPVVVDVGGHEITCKPLNHDEREMFVSLVEELNDVIENASENTIRGGIHPNPVWSAGPFVEAWFAGHGACQYGDEEWINAYSTGGGISDHAGLNSFHPKSAGQAAYAFAFADALEEEAEQP